MKISNIKRSAALAALLTAGSMFGAANQIELTAQIASKAIVGFSDVSTSTQTGAVFVDDALNSINFGTESAGGTHSEVIRQVYVESNNPSGVSMAISDLANGGNLKHTNGTDEITMNYSFNANAITLGTAFDLTTSTSSGSTSVGNMVFTPSATSANIASGTYSTTLTVTIAAN